VYNLRHGVALLVGLDTPSLSAQSGNAYLLQFATSIGTFPSRIECARYVDNVVAKSRIEAAYNILNDVIYWSIVPVFIAWIFYSDGVRRKTYLGAYFIWLSASVLHFGFSRYLNDTLFKFESLPERISTILVDGLVYSLLIILLWITYQLEIFQLTMLHTIYRILRKILSNND
jgi:hypothetical protein